MVGHGTGMAGCETMVWLWDNGLVGSGTMIWPWDNCMVGHGTMVGDVKVLGCGEAG